MLSVCVAIYNVESFLEKCLQSIVGQTYSDLEIILVDDGSTDGSSAICDQFALQDKRIKVIRKNNSGLLAARKSGIDAASGEWITFVDADDYVEKVAYQECMEFCNNYDCIAFGFYRDDIIDGTMASSGGIVRGHYSNTLSEYVRILHYGGSITLWNKIYKKISLKI